MQPLHSPLTMLTIMPMLVHFMIGRKIAGDSPEREMRAFMKSPISESSSAAPSIKITDEQTASRYAPPGLLFLIISTHTQAMSAIAAALTISSIRAERGL